MLGLQRKNKKKISKLDLILILESKYKELNKYLSKSIYKDLLIGSIENIETENSERWDEILLECAKLATLEVDKNKDFDEAYGIIYKSMTEYNDK